MAQFLVADDEQRVRSLIKTYIEMLGHEAVVVANGEEALRQLFQDSYDGLFTDLRMPGLDGMGLIRAIHEENIHLPTIVVTAYASVESVIEAFQLGVVDFITKPFSSEEIKRAVQRILRQKIQLKETNQYIRGLIEQKALFEAVNYLKPLFSEYPSSPIPHYLFGLIQETQGDFSGALRHMQAALALEPGYDPATRKIIEIRKKIEEDRS